MMEAEFIEHLGVLKIEPGDTIVIKSPVLLSTEQVERIKECVSRHFPQNRVMLLEAGKDIGVIKSTARPYPLE